MTRREVEEALARLAQSGPSDGPDVLPIVTRVLAGPASLFFGVDERGSHCVLLSCEKPGYGFPTFRTEVLRCEFVSSVRLSLEGSDHRLPALVLRCEDPAEFADVFGALVSELARMFQTDPVARAWESAATLLTRWSDFFRKERTLGDEVAAGLWGEMVVITASDDVRGAVAAWRGGEGATYDFFASGAVLEVKVGTRRGVHRVSHAQADSSGVSGGLLSLHALADPMGRGLNQLEIEILSKLSDSAPYYEALRRRGVSPSAMKKTDRRWALVSPPAVYRLEDVPCVLAIQPGVSELSYKVTLNDDKRLDPVGAEPILSPFGIDLTKLSR